MSALTLRAVGTTGTSSVNNTMEAALDLAEFGWFIVPLHWPTETGEKPICSCYQGENCHSVGKHPHSKCAPNGLKDATRDPEVIAGWFERFPRLNIGVRTGPESQVWMVGPDGDEGNKQFEALEAEHGRLPDTCVARTGSGGHHYIFAWPADGDIGNSANIRDLKIDVRGADGYFIAAPSLHKSGLHYEWVTSLQDCLPAGAPEWLIEWVRDGQRKDKIEAADQIDATVRPSLNGTYASASTEGRCIEYLSKIPGGVQGQNGSKPTMYACRAAVYGFDLGVERGLQLVMEHYNQKCSPEWTEKELRHKCEDANAKPFQYQRGWLRDKPLPAAKVRLSSDKSLVFQAVDGVSSFVTREEFPVSALPSTVQTYVEEQAKAIGCDTAAVALPALATMGGAIGVKREIILKGGKVGWREFPIVWAGVVAASGSAKTPGQKAGTMPAKTIEVELYEDHKKELERWEKATPEELEGKQEPQRRRFLISDCTVEWVAIALNQNKAGLLLDRDELDGWYQSMNQYKSKGGADRSNWLSMHHGGQACVDRKNGTNVLVPRAAVSITGTIQPGVLKAALNPQARSSGLGARLLLAYLPKRRRVWTEATVSDSAFYQYDSTIRGLFNLPWMGEPIAVSLSEPAKDLFVSFFNEWNQDAEEYDDDLSATWAKLEAYAPRFALIHHLADTSNKVIPTAISAESMNAGITLARWFGQEAKRVYAMLDANEDNDEQAVVNWMKQRGGRCTARDLHRACKKRFPTMTDAETVLQSLVRHGLATTETDNPNGGRPSTIYILSSVTKDKTQPAA